MKKIKFYEMFLQIFSQIKISQRFFEITKLFYVKINHTRITCCCRVTHVEFSMHYDVYHYICCTLNTNEIFQECGLKLPLKSLREFIASVLCK